MELSRVLFCDYEGDFEYADVLSRLGYVVDQVRPDGLRSISVGEHSVYVFSFKGQKNTQKALRICEKLKSAELLTPIILMSRDIATPEFLNHQKNEMSADAYVANPVSESGLLDTLDDLVGSPPLHNIIPDDHQPKSLNEVELLKREEEYRERIHDMESELQELKGSAEQKDKALQAQREFYKPKLKALLDGTKLQVQSETERMKVKLSEVEARLLDREARIKELEQIETNHAEKLKGLMLAHQKAQESLRAFYQNKIRRLRGEISNANKAPGEIPQEPESSDS